MIWLLVIAHEVGHFIAARLSGVRVDKFSIGLGPKITSFTHGGTEYILAALPLGGYVKMAGEAAARERTGAADEFQAKTPWQRIRIALAGPIASLTLPFLIMPLVYLLGTPQNFPAAVGQVSPSSVAGRAGFASGDVITSIGGSPVHSWAEAIRFLEVSGAQGANIVVKRGPGPGNSVRPQDSFNMARFRALGLIPASLIRVSKVFPDMPAEKAGIRVDDELLTVDGKVIYSWDQFLGMTRDGHGKAISVAIARQGVTQQVRISPQLHKGRYVIGIEHAAQQQIVKYGLFDSIRLGFDKTVALTAQTGNTFYRLITGRLSMTSLVGPVEIANMSGSAAQTGLSHYLALLADLSISLGIINLLPIPVLDGGMILFCVIEVMRKKPLSHRWMEVSARIGAAAIITVVITVTYNDIARLFARSMAQ